MSRISDQDYYHLDYAAIPRRQGHDLSHQGFATECAQTAATADFDFAELDKRLGLVEPECEKDRAFR